MFDILYLYLSVTEMPDGTALDKTVVSGFPEISNMKNTILTSFKDEAICLFGYINVLDQHWSLFEKTVFRVRPESIFLVTHNIPGTAAITGKRFTSIDK